MPGLRHCQRRVTVPAASISSAAVPGERRDQQRRHYSLNTTSGVLATVVDAAAPAPSGGLDDDVVKMAVTIAVGPWRQAGLQ